MRRPKGNYVESMVSMARKYEGLVNRFPLNVLTEFEIKMMKAFKVELTKRGYFELSEKERKALI